MCRLIFATLGFSLFNLAFGVPVEHDNVKKRFISGDPLIGTNFADPSYVRVDNDGFYAFATGSDNKNISMAHTEAFYGQPWSVDPADALPTVGAWSTGKNVWAPTVVQLNPTSFVMYYTAESHVDSRHCIGAATASSIKGPYTPLPDTLACPTDQGGAIDPSAFQDVDGKRYVVYKVDGNQIGRGGECNNDKLVGKKPTPIMLQEVDETGVKPVGPAATILDRDDRDGPLVEAPSLSRIQDPTSAGGWLYYLFFSSGCYSESSYDISYATSTNGVTNGGKHYDKAKLPLMQTGADGNKLYAPGGLYSDVDLGQNQFVVFHADQGTSSAVRPMWGGTLVVDIPSRTIQLDTAASGVNH